MLILLLARLGLQFHEICYEVSPKDGGGTEHPSHHGPGKSTQKYILPRQVEPGYANLGSKVGHSVGGESHCVMVDAIDLTAGGTKVVHVTERGTHLKVLSAISKLREQLTHLHIVEVKRKRIDNGNLSTETV